MLILVAALSGAILGALRARARGGTTADMAQYGIAHAIALGLVGLFATIALEYSL